jgi:hypothetical protein
MRNAGVVLAIAVLAATFATSARAQGDEPREPGEQSIETPPGQLPPPSNGTSTHEPRAKRKSGELVLLYMTGIAWGGSAGVFVDALQYANRPAASADLGAVLLAPLAAGVGCLLPTVVDAAYGRRPGAAQTVASSMLIGLGEAVALNEYFGNRASTSFHTYTKDAAWIFGGLTAGMATGLGIAGLVKTTPGRAAWVETTGLFGGVFAASLTGAFSRHSGLTPFGREDIRNVAVAGALVGAAGVGVGLGTATLLSPSVLRVHIIDLGWIGATAAAVAACSKCQPADAFTASAVAGGVGFAATFLATMSLPKVGLAETFAPPVTPYAMPLPGGGLEVGVGGTL